jgi:hypothetical protein
VHRLDLKLDLPSFGGGEMMSFSFITIASIFGRRMYRHPCGSKCSYFFGQRGVGVKVVEVEERNEDWRMEFGRDYEEIIALINCISSVNIHFLK